MKNARGFDEKDIYLLDYNDVELDSGIDIEDIEGTVIERIKERTMSKVIAHKGKKVDGTGHKRKSLGQWFALQNRISKIAAIILCFIGICGVALGCIALVRQYVPGVGIVSDSSKLKVLASPYTIWKDGYYLRITRLSFNSDTKLLNFSAESNWFDPQDDTTSGGIYFKEKWSQATPFSESTGKDHQIKGSQDTVTEFSAEYKLRHKLDDYYFELDTGKVSFDYNGKGEHTYTSDFSIVIPLADLKLVAAAEAYKLEDLGQIVESNGINAVAVSRWDNGILYADILFKSNKPNENVESFNIGDESEIELVTADNRKYYNVGGRNFSKGWKYLLFKTDEPVNGAITLNSLFLQKMVNKPIKLNVPKVGETKTLNQKVTFDGVTVIIESIEAYYVDYYRGIEADVRDTEESAVGRVKGNKTGIDVKCRIVESVSDGRITDDKSYIRGELRLGKVENESKAYFWGSQGLIVSGHFDTEQLKKASEITLLINDIMLSAQGNWEIPIVTK